MMKLVRSPDMADSIGYAATEKRYSVVLRAEVVTDDPALRVWVRVINISAGGLMIVAPVETVLSGMVTIVIPHLDDLGGHIVWAKNNCFGVKFDRVIDPEALMSERARRASAKARETRDFVENSASVFAEAEDGTDVLPFVAMMRSNSERRAAA